MINCLKTSQFELLSYLYYPRALIIQGGLHVPAGTSLRKLLAPFLTKRVINLLSNYLVEFSYNSLLSLMTEISLIVLSHFKNAGWLSDM